jgi:ubiquitin-protein ligase
MLEGLRTEDGKNNRKLRALGEYEIALETDTVEILMSFIKDEVFLGEISVKNPYMHATPTSRFMQDFSRANIVCSANLCLRLKTCRL